jgi:hypothetical protein
MILSISNSLQASEPGGRKNTKGIRHVMANSYHFFAV